MQSIEYYNNISFMPGIFSLIISLLFFGVYFEGYSDGNELEDLGNGLIFAGFFFLLPPKTDNRTILGITTGSPSLIGFLISIGCFCSAYFILKSIGINKPFFLI